MTKEGRIIKWYGTGTDIDHTKRSAEILQRTEAQRFAIIEKAPIGMYLVDAELRLREINQRARPFFGLFEDAIGKDLRNVMLALWPKGTATKIAFRFQETLKTGQSYHAMFTRKSPDGETEWYDWEIHRITLPDGQCGVVCYFIDISPHVRAQQKIQESEQDLRKLSETLENRVKERTRELQEKTNRLRRLASELVSAEHRERKRLAALLHDDLQQLLVAAKMLTGIMGRHVINEEGKWAAAQADRWIGEAAEAARDLTRQLRPPILYEGGLVPALEWLAAEIEERHGLKVSVLAGTLSSRLNDDIKALLFECVRELLFNVAKYANAPSASVAIQEEGHDLRVAVQDDGKGFDISSVAKNARNNGFGLFSIRERIAALGGAMVIESSPGQGTRIQMTLPVREEENSLAETSQAGLFKPATPGDKRRSAFNKELRIRILVVDDHTLVREGIANTINSDKRMTVVGEAADGFEAIQSVAKYSPDIVLMDLNMPRMNGIEATREIRRNWPSVIVIGLSVQSDYATAKSMIEAGASRFLSKAGDTEQMIATIAELAQLSLLEENLE